MADHQNRFFHRKKIMTIFFVCAAVLCGLLGRLLYLMVWRAEYYEEAATRLHERERSIKAARGRILDRNGVVLADNKMVCTVSVIHNQIEEPEQVIAILVKELGISEEEARKRVEKYSSIERVKSNVDKTVGDRIREYDLAGVKVDDIILTGIWPARCWVLPEETIRESSDWKWYMKRSCRGIRE